MPRIIFKCPYLKSGARRSAAHRKNYVTYMAIRDGVDPIDPGTAHLPATQKQLAMAEQLAREFPLSRGLFEYGDYLTAPTRGNASAFIVRAIEDNLDQIAKRENYVSYIAHRPRAQKMGAHGLFSDNEDGLVLSQVADLVAHHPGNVWLPIISLRREDAARLGYDNAENWKKLLSGCAFEMAEAMQIPQDKFRWYAAFHNEAGHPHVHMVCFSADGRSGFLTKAGIEKIKSGLARQIFRQELTELYTQQTQRRDELTRDAGDTLRRLTGEMRSGTLANERIERLMEHLAERLKTLPGKKQYGYLPAPLKSVVDEVVNELERDPRVAEAYRLWYDLRKEVLRTYQDSAPDLPPLSQQKEFKRIKNIVIEEAVRLGAHPQAEQSGEAHSDEGASEVETDDSVFQREITDTLGSPSQVLKPLTKYGQSAGVAQSATRLLRHLGGIFREQVPTQSAGICLTDHKLMRKIREKKIAMGHKADDHESTLSFW